MPDPSDDRGPPPKSRRPIVLQAVIALAVLAIAAAILLGVAPNFTGQSG